MAEAMQAAGNLIGGAASYENGKYNQGLAETEAVEAERAGTAEEARVREAARAQIGEQLAAQGANGFAMGTGSALDALQQSQINAALDAMQVRQEAAGRARAARVQGAIARAQGNNDLVKGMFGAASSAYRMKADWANPLNGRKPTAPSPAPRVTGSTGYSTRNGGLYEGP